MKEPLLSEVWHLRCRFTWYCNSKATLSRVRRFALRSSYRRRLPPDADLLPTILSHPLAIKCCIRHRWVKDHQDAGSSGLLSRAAKLNVTADSLATDYRTLGSLKSSPRVAHVAEQGCSISTNGLRWLTSQFDGSIRYHVNGYHS